MHEYLYDGPLDEPGHTGASSPLRFFCSVGTSTAPGATPLTRIWCGVR